jgi:hypothetical protein
MFVLLSDTHSGNKTTLSWRFRLQFGSQMLLPLSMVCISVFIYPSLDLLNELSVSATSRGHIVEGVCITDHILRARIAVFSVFITDLVLLALMFSGILRWREHREWHGIWWLLYTQVSILHPSADGVAL